MLDCEVDCIAKRQQLRTSHPADFDIPAEVDGIEERCTVDVDCSVVIQHHEHRIVAAAESNRRLGLRAVVEQLDA